MEEGIDIKIRKDPPYATPVHYNLHTVDDASGRAMTHGVYPYYDACTKYNEAYYTVRFESTVPLKRRHEIMQGLCDLLNAL